MATTSTGHEIMSHDFRNHMFREFTFGDRRALYHIGTNSLFSEQHPLYKLYSFLEGKSDTLALSDDDLEDVLIRWENSQRWHRPKVDDQQFKITQIAISPTLSCNLSCNYCYNFQELPEAKIRKLPSLDRPGIKKILHTLSQLPIDSRINVAFIGGEPLLHTTQLERLIRITQRAASERDIKVNFLVTTNGLTLGRSDVIDLVNKYRISVSISMDGPRAWHNETRHLLNGAGSYDKIIKSIERFLANYHSPYKSVRATYKLLPGRLSGTYKHMKELGFNDIAMGSSDFDSKVMDPDTTSALHEEVASVSLDIESDMISGTVSRHSWFTEIFINLYVGNVKQVICGATRNHVAFDVFGGMQACHRYLGNDKYELSPEDITSRQKSSLLPEVLKFGKTKHCHECWARSLCGGECFHVGKEIHGKVEAELLQDQICNFKRVKFREGIRAYVSIMETQPEIMPRLVYGIAPEQYMQNPNMQFEKKHANSC